MLLLRLSGVLLLRYEDNRFSGSLLFHVAPRNTRFGRSSHFRHGRHQAAGPKSVKTPPAALRAAGVEKKKG